MPKPPLSTQEATILRVNNDILCLLRFLRAEGLKRSSADDSQHDGHTTVHLRRHIIIAVKWRQFGEVWTPKLLGEV